MSRSSAADFVQKVEYAFGAYRNFLGEVLDHDPSMFDLPSPTARIADIGCGYGESLASLRSRGYTNLVGVEPEPDAPA